MSEKESFVILDNQCIPANHINHQALAEYDMFYEVMRVIDGKLAFMNAHLYRMQESLALSGVKKSLPKKYVQQKIKLCIRVNHIKHGNIRVSVFSDGKHLKWLTEVIPHHYPSEKDYTNGIDVAVARFQRERPNVKKWNQSMKNVLARYKDIKNVYEVLFYNEHGYLTEGGKSNVFFVVDDTVVTAPDNMVLKGVTRKYVIECIKNIGLKFEENPVHVTNLLKYDAIFITGTSPKVLPVREVRACCHADPKHPAVRKIMKAYNDILYENLN
ncbi:MAG: aminotransferase class IV [Candidatus Delongbacteria bacterium]|jgi:branched-chain amino acid aminotransferase|nr:aminotransferase class IV [Candidatus Delongbacteria bacterium]